MYYLQQSLLIDSSSTSSGFFRAEHTPAGEETFKLQTESESQSRVDGNAWSSEGIREEVDERVTDKKGWNPI